MELTGKCKEDFEKWLNPKYLEDVETGSGINVFEHVGNEMKYGVFVDFFDSVGIRVSIRNIGSSYWYVINYPNTLGLKDRYESKYTERPEARTAAIEKANEIYNK